MDFVQIMRGLEANRAEGIGAEQAAKTGFLVWAVSLDIAAGVAARSALGNFAVISAQSAAARIFVGFLRAAALADMVEPLSRRGGAAARRRGYGSTH